MQRRKLMEIQQRETGLSSVRINEGETFVYCSVSRCGNQISIRIGGPGVQPYHTDPKGNPLCEGCAIEH